MDFKAQAIYFKLIFWGLPFLLIDYTWHVAMGRYIVPVDFFPDLIGCILIFFGLVKISKLSIEDTAFTRKIRYSLFAVVLFVMLLLGEYVVIFLKDYFVNPRAELEETILSVLHFFADWGLIAFAGAMMVLANNLGLIKSADHWKIARKLLLWVYFVPTVLLIMVPWLIRTTVVRFLDEIVISSWVWLIYMDLGAFSWVVFLTLITIIPIAYFLITLYSMANTIKRK